VGTQIAPAPRATENILEEILLVLVRIANTLDELNEWTQGVDVSLERIEGKMRL
jgi:hypothetical protein